MPCVNVFWDAVRTLQSGKYESIVILEHNQSLTKHCQLSVFAVVTINGQQNSRSLATSTSGNSVTEVTNCALIDESCGSCHNDPSFRALNTRVPK